MTEDEKNYFYDLLDDEESKKITSKKWAEIFGVSASTISNWKKSPNRVDSNIMETCKFILSLPEAKRKEAINSILDNSSIESWKKAAEAIMTLATSTVLPSLWGGIVGASIAHPLNRTLKDPVKEIIERLRVIEQEIDDEDKA